jgi:hypothetical protein
MLILFNDARFPSCEFGVSKIVAVRPRHVAGRALPACRASVR